MKKSKEQSLEDILIEARDSGFYYKYRKVNKTLILVLGVLAFLNMIPFFYFVFGRQLNRIVQDLVNWFITYIITLPLAATLLSLFIAIIPFYQWKYEYRLVRLIWIILTVFYSFALLIQIIFIFNENIS